MSIPVAIEALRTEAERYPFAYFLTVGDDGRSHAVAVQPNWTDAGTLLIGSLGRRTSANATARPNVSLVFPPASIDDYSLIVDGDASVDANTITFAPTNAVLHRPAPASADPTTDAPSSCGSDCIPIGVSPTTSHAH